MAVFPGTPAHPAHAAPNSVSSASAPIHVWMPNHPQATMARSSAGTFAPRTPKLARHNTGNDTPYFVPACAFRIMGTSTIVLPRRIVTIACHQFMPCDMSPDASVYVVMTTLMPIQSAAMLYVDHVRRSGSVGARSAFQSGLSAMLSDGPAAGGANVVLSAPVCVVIGRQRPRESGIGNRESTDPGSRRPPRGSSPEAVPIPDSQFPIPDEARRLGPLGRQLDSRQRSLLRATVSCAR